MGIAIVFDMVIRFAMLLIFIRFMLQFAGVHYRNPYAMPAYKATQIVDVFGRIFPTVAQGRISIAAIVLMFLLRLIDIWGSSLLQNQGLEPIQLFFLSSMTLILDFLRMLRYVIFASIIISWIVIFTNSIHPIAEIIMQISEPILAPFRKILPDLGMIDLSPMIAFFVIYLAEILIREVSGSILPMIGFM